MSRVRRFSLAPDAEVDQFLTGLGQRTTLEAEPTEVVERTIYDTFDWRLHNDGSVIERQVREFEMPGTGIPNFSALASEIAATGIYDFSLHHSQVLVPVVLRHWNIEALEGLDAEAEQARDRIVAYINRVGSIAERMAQRRAAKLAGASA